MFFAQHRPPTRSYTLSLHDALPISARERDLAGELGMAEVDARIDDADQDGLQRRQRRPEVEGVVTCEVPLLRDEDRKSTRLNSSHTVISYAVFCLKKKKTIQTDSSI